MKKPLLITTLLINSVYSNFLFAQETKNEVQELDLLFVGDIMGHGPQITSATIIKDSLYDYNPCFEYVAPVIKEADFAIGNLELTLPGKGPYSGYPQFRSPDALATALKNAGFDLLVTANNHSNDAFKNGVEKTIQTLRKEHFFQTGTFLNEVERNIFYPLIVYQGDIKLAFLNYTYGTNGIPSTAPTIVNLIEEEQIKKDIADAKAMEADFIIVLLHWGYEYQINENKYQSALAEKVFEWGGDLIIGAHPHVIQPLKYMEVMRADSVPFKGLVAYSLGNFISNQRQALTNMGLMVGITLKKDLKTQKTWLDDHHYIPVYRHIEKTKENKRVYRSIPVSLLEAQKPDAAFMSAEEYKAMLSVTEKIRKHLKKFDSKERVLSLSPK